MIHVVHGAADVRNPVSAPVRLDEKVVVDAKAGAAIHLVEAAQLMPAVTIQEQKVA